MLTYRAYVSDLIYQLLDLITPYNRDLGLTSHIASLDTKSAPYLNFWETDDRCSMSHHFFGKQTEHPDFLNPWRGHEAHIARKVVGDQGLYLLAAAQGYKAPFHFQRTYFS
ncbi:hypothetical protein PoB_002365000 [Plakobranchus ocellatus]|uniref:Uncharacterized protein n=1 Tax=Plakobranchus ocellatus TaxID=259542 RepID=A0AAV3ZN81_9GAST|nr:hypothetical protein PoB_002365000 [Plakobranchus ocellatus]